MLASFSDEELVAMVQRGDCGTKEFGRAHALLLERTLPVICARVDALARSGGAAQSREDLMQEGMLGFLNAVSAFGACHGASFRTFASVCVTNRVISALRRGGQATGSELLESDLPAGMAAMDPQDIFSAMEETRRMMEVIQTQLTQLERGVMEGYLAGERYDAIAKHLGVTAKAVDNALQRVRKKLREFL